MITEAFLKKYWILFIATLLLIALTVGGYFQIIRDKKMSNSISTKAIIVKPFQHIRGGAIISFINSKGKVIETEINCDCRKLKENDTILIEYSLEDPFLARVTDINYMEKYKNH